MKTVKSKKPKKDTGIKTKPVKEKHSKETEQEDMDSTTPDPTKPDTETTHVKRHKIGFVTKINKKEL